MSHPCFEKYPRLFVPSFSLRSFAKKIITCVVLLLSLHSGIQAQWTNNSDGNGIIYNGRATVNVLTASQYLQTQLWDAYPGDGFTYAGFSMPNYGIKFVIDPWQTGASTQWVSGYGGIKFFTKALPRLAIAYEGNIGIGTASPAARLDIGYTDANSKSIILGRLPEGNGTGDGTYLGIQTGQTTNTDMSFAIQHKFYGQLNSSIDFHRGGSETGGFLTFSTGNGTEQMRLDPSGNLCIGTVTSLGNNKLMVNGATLLVGDVQINGTTTGTGNLRIGSPGDAGNINVPLGAVTGGYNIDFAGYRDIYSNEIGARVRAERVNNWVANNALVQGTDLTFSTSPGDSPSSLTERMRIKNDGSVSIGTTDARGYLFAVNGAAIFTKVVVKNNANWPDYVFDSAYQLPSLNTVQQYIQQNKHLPEMPAADSVQQNGVDIAANQAALLKKVEELTLYIIQQDQKIAILQKEMGEMKKQPVTTHP